MADSLSPTWVFFTVSLLTYIRKNIHPLILNSAQKSHFSTQSKQPQHQNLRQWNKTISHLIRNGQLIHARQVFDEMPQRSVVTWNSMISGYIRRREIAMARKMFDEMPERDIVSWNLIISGYVLCKGTRHIEEGRWLFDRMPVRDLVSWNTMISGYARNGRMEHAMCLFREMPERNVVSWNAVITGFLQNGDVLSAIEVFERMPMRDSASLSTLISGLIRNGKLDEAADFLDKSGKMGDFGYVVDAYNTLIAGYGQNGRVDEARRLFDQIPLRLNREIEEDREVEKNGGNQRFERNIISWNSMIMCYVKAGDIFSARQVFNEMPERDSFSWNTMISGYVHVSDVEQAASLFCEMPEPDACSWNSMILVYAQHGEVEIARDFFDRMPQKSLISWNSMIAGYEQNGDYEGAIKLFSQMQMVGERPDRHTLSSILSACAGLVGLYQGRQIHQCVVKTVTADTPINNSLITMYSRCGNIVDARSVFDEMKAQRDVVSWNAMIGGYAQHGFAEKALEQFREMKRMMVQPTHITFVSVLNACTHAGLVAEGQKQFDSMASEFGIPPRVEHFASLVDIIGRRGNLKDAMELIEGMPVVPDTAVWGALLGACRVHNDMDLARIAAEALMRIEPESSAPYVLLYNMYADAGRWVDAMDVRMRMDRNGIRKQPGYSWVELHNNVHVFVAGDRSHPQADEIHALIENSNRVIKDLISNQYLLIFDEEGK
ncbi:mitochondrial editing factor 9 [Tasmannia lanceolata]|uniref:mitochondrial editing factor 9 n=1 Tax=Tasmannia lanceolata TaxID=3420 RepID=UPI0040638F11